MPPTREEPGMVRTLLLSAALAAALCAAGDRPAARADEPGPRPPAEVDQLRPGMSQDEVRRLLGPPRQTARQILYRRYLEQWVYDGPNAVRIEFDCVRGKEPQILTVHPLST